jgi:hypothetical protein
MRSAAAAARRRLPRYERRSPSDLPQPATTSRPKASVSGPPAASPYPILRGVSRQLCAVLRLVARYGGGRGAKDGAHPVCPRPSSCPASAMAPARHKGRRRRPRLKQGGTSHCGSTPVGFDSSLVACFPQRRRHCHLARQHSPTAHGAPPRHAKESLSISPESSKRLDIAQPAVYAAPGNGSGRAPPAPMPFRPQRRCL